MTTKARREPCSGSGQAPRDIADRIAYGRNICPECNGVQFVTAAGLLRKHPPNLDPKLDADVLRKS